jgi:hypothetical protein
MPSSLQRLASVKVICRAAVDTFSQLQSTLDRVPVMSAASTRDPVVPLERGDDLVTLYLEHSFKMPRRKSDTVSTDGTFEARRIGSRRAFLLQSCGHLSSAHLAAPKHPVGVAQPLHHRSRLYKPTNGNSDKLIDASGLLSVCSAGTAPAQLA